MVIADLLPLLVTILTNIPAAVESVHNIWNLATQDTAPTADEQSAMDAALDAAHQALQNS